MSGLGNSLLKQLYPDPPPPHKVSPVAFGEAIYEPHIWKGYKHIRVMEQAILDAINTPGGGRLIIAVSVRHGKSMLTSRIFPAWFMGMNPDKRCVLVGHEADFASRHGGAVRDILTEHGPEYFGVQVSQRSKASNRWDIEGREGGMLTLGIGGSPIGRGGDLVIVDDPYKSYEEAMMPRVRERVFEFVAGTLTSRIAPNGTLIIVCARWHVEDIIGQLQEAEPDVWTVLRMPAICDDPTTDPIGRQLGDPLWPEIWPVSQLEQRKRAVSLIDGTAVWDAQYQQVPSGVDGDMFKRDKWNYVATIPECNQWCRSWDLAATKDGGDFTVGALYGRYGGRRVEDQRFAIADIVRGRWDADEVRRQMVACAKKDPRGTMIEIPQDPGQAGKAQIKDLIALLAGYGGRVRGILQSGKKEVRANGLSNHQLAGNISIPDSPSYTWVGPLIQEADGFPNSAHDDQIDALAGAHNRLAGGGFRIIV